jgi:hypothetical protein
MNYPLLSALFLCVAACSSSETGGGGGDAAVADSASPTGDSGVAETSTGTGTCTAETGAACGTCHKGDKGIASCGTVDNSCNDDATCNGAENAWFACLCFAKGDAAASTKCDDTFKTNGGSAAASVVTCLRGACTGICY